MPIVGYNAQDICHFYDRSPLVVGWRLNSIGFPLLGMFVCLFSFYDTPGVWGVPCLVPVYVSMVSFIY